MTIDIKRRLWIMLAAFALVWMLTPSCSTGDGNAFEAVDDDAPAIRATLAIEEGNADRAVSILEDALKSDPGNVQYLSILSTAYALQVGIDLIQIALDIALGGGEDSSSDDESSEEEGNEITGLFKVLPAATDANIAGLERAISTISSIPESSRTTVTNLKMTILYTARVSLRSKKFDSDGDGTFTAEELENLSEDDAEAILDSILNAEQAITFGDDGSESATASAEQIATIRTELDQQEGDTTSEKIRNYLESNPDAAAE